MARWTEDVNKAPVLVRQSSLPRMLTLDQVAEVLNLGKPVIYTLVNTGELPAGQFGGRGVWRVRESDLVAYIDAAFKKTAERIASGQIPDSDTVVED